ncbi:prolipoprotein diacylglyceryl transferase [Microbulbifer thermotolerans]|uniref:Phosphatidylglycerol--prolipoprotein diacylglyceryl transferase n=1 Tax=Microbulbifer thermotolerans TaxID=252514 RepID=A0AB35HV32_MICTH|nr:prolipoprotein diacylglyceryl transferase [Microbulbifer thermotolerans]MCX2778169.1 prolipoprotein diacylglyceryl transferase [Microbulbifer thermotolerans]MCX2795289.1 prolipoprotein diacylglyceryl transferase [Microbulbifer thermotolerans]MCX2801149.1 prolipoprotein diacylglyceryl transferase [Microbulbifer thermotolerans]MCX2804517.1 prolipoprotein diacylglyceryl transferase [Microbulbifer thermotolerans]MCX2835224.1 prolipoprotein diacylglyceryl transferase [Microbulbifer thermotoleran
MIPYPEIDPVAIAIGPLKVHWYGLMYLVGFIAAWLLALKRSAKPWSPVIKSEVEDLILYCAIGVVAGGRLGYMVFYNLGELVEHPLSLFKVWEGGMSFHGGLLGVIVAATLYARKIGTTFPALIDFVAPLVPIGLGLGRIGNFIGQELWGRPTDVPWGMVFPRDPELLVRHPSQLYQAFLEGAVLFAILWWFSSKPRPRLAVGGLFLTLYGIFRFLVEFVREPDAHIGYEWFGWMTRGQELCLPMIAIGIALLVWSYRTQPLPESRSDKKNVAQAKEGA